MFRADVRVLEEFYEPWRNHGYVRYYANRWKECFEKEGIDTEGISVYFDQRGGFNITGTKDQELLDLITQIESPLYNVRAGVFRDEHSVPVKRWWKSLEKYTRRDRGFITISFSNKKFRVKESVYEDILKRMRVYRLMDEFYTVNGMVGLDEIVLHVLEEELLIHGEDEYRRNHVDGTDPYMTEREIVLGF